MINVRQADQPNFVVEIFTSSVPRRLTHPRIVRSFDSLDLRKHRVTEKSDAKCINFERLSSDLNQIRYVEYLLFDVKAGTFIGQFESLLEQCSSKMSIIFETQ